MDTSGDESDMPVDGSNLTVGVDPYLNASIGDDELDPPSSATMSVDPYMLGSTGDDESPSFTSPDRTSGLSSTPHLSPSGTSSASPAPTSSPPATSLTSCKEIVEKGFECMSRLTAIKRLNRLVRPRVDGTFIVPEELVTQYKQASTKEDVIAEFIRCGGVKELMTNPYIVQPVYTLDLILNSIQLESLLL